MVVVGGSIPFHTKLLKTFRVSRSNSLIKLILKLIIHLHTIAMVWVRISLLSDEGVNQGVLFEESRCTSLDVITALGEEVEYQILEDHVPDMSQFVVARQNIRPIFFIHLSFFL